MEATQVGANRCRSSAPKEGTCRKIALVVENGSEEEFIAAVKKFKPNVGKEELKAWIMRFHDVRREKHGL